MKREPWDVDAKDFAPSEEAIKAALLCFKEGRPVNCIHIAHMAKAASLYIKMRGTNNMTDENPHGNPEDPYETIKVIEAWGLDKNFNLGTVISKVRTAEKSDDNVQSLKDARWYLDREISKLEGMPHPSQADMFNQPKKED